MLNVYLGSVDENTFIIHMLYPVPPFNVTQLYLDLVEFDYRAKCFAS